MIRASTPIAMSERPIIAARSVDQSRPLKVICIGAGISGIVCGIKLPQMVKDLELVIYDKNEEIGGTWFENQYPGCACDIPSHCYQLSFESNPAWSTFYASGTEILDYWKRIVAKYELRKYMRLSHKVLEAKWNQTTCKWLVTIKNLQTGEIFEDTADSVVQCIGSLNEWKWPDIKGLHDFKGKLLHSASWDKSYDYKDKKVAVIGAGSSGIQITPSIQPHVAHLDQYIRGKTWIADTFVNEDVHKRDQGKSNFSFTDEEIEAWKKDPELYMAYRRRLEAQFQSGHPITVKGSEEQAAAREDFTKLMKDRLAKKSHLASHILPDFPPVCKRLTPGPGFLEALTEDNVEVVHSKISHITPSGIVAEDGKLREVDAIVCATGFDTTYMNRLSVRGVDGLTLKNRWLWYPETYLSIAVDDFPNFFMTLGPNSALGAGNLLILIEYAVQYIGKALAKIQTQNIEAMCPRAAAVEAFTRFSREYFEGTVFSERCSSWYKGGKETGHVVALWPGSSLHAVKALSEPRWEDWRYIYLNDNEVGWLGDGWSQMDREDGLDKTFYLAGKGNMLDMSADAHEEDEEEWTKVDGKEVERRIDEGLEKGDVSMTMS